MPRKEINLPYRVEYISVLDESGQADPELEPQLPGDFLLKLYRSMLFTRRFDERMLIMQRQGRIGTFAPLKGQEAAQIGAIAALEPEDWLIPSFRESGGEIWRGKRPEDILLIYSGYNEGGYIPEGVRNLPVAVPVGSQTLHAVGIGYALKYRRTGQVAMVFLGDGATSEGDFHEAMNFAAVFEAPVVFVCQNNHWAISIPRSRQSRSETLAQKAIAYAMPGVQVDGNDVLAVYRVASEAIERARAGQGPTFIECITYRLSVHTTADDPRRYRSEAEVEEWSKRDPIKRFEIYLVKKGLMDEQKLQEVEEGVKAEVKAAEERWEERMRQPVDPLDMFQGAYAEMPGHLAAQREELRRELLLKRGEQEKEPIVRDGSV